MGVLDDIWTGLKNVIDQTVTYVMQGVNIAVQQLAKLALAGIGKLVEFSKAIEAYDPTGKLRVMRLDMQLAVSNAGIGAIAGGDITAKNAAVQAESDKRQQARRDEFTAREVDRQDKIIRLEDERRTIASEADTGAAAAVAATQGNLAALMARAQAAAQAAQQQQADEIDRQRQLAAVTQSRTGPSIGATFSAATLMALGGGKNTIQDRTVKAAEKTAKKLDDLVSLQKEAVALAKVNKLAFAP
jgi:hypothetical protein